MIETPTKEAIHLLDDFPSVDTADWEAAIRRDLKGADYDSKLMWRLEDGIVVRPYYRRNVLERICQTVRAIQAGTRVDAQSTTVSADAIRADYLHDAGATPAQELAFALAEGVEMLATGSGSGASLQVALGRIEFIYAVGPLYFVEIAKLRAARLLWRAIVCAFGVEAEEAIEPRIHVRTARLNMSLLDPATNLLRVTTEAAAALIGGCDSLVIEPWGWDRQLAECIERILREEAHLTRVADAAGGSYYVEALTEALAQEAWRLFQHVEAGGGWSAALKSGAVEKALEESRARKENAFAVCRQTMIGVNNYLNDGDDLTLANEPPPFSSDPFRQARLAEPFEELRCKAGAQLKKTGRVPRVLLLKRGDCRISTARANFCLNFFGCGGFEVVEAGKYSGDDVDLIVLCSSDSEYEAFAAEVCSHTLAPVLVASYPLNGAEHLRKAGVQGFVYAGANILEILTAWQDKLNGRSHTK
jgi:methylmalonyl-CoA mutase